MPANFENRFCRPVKCLRTFKIDLTGLQNARELCGLILQACLIPAEK